MELVCYLTFPYYQAFGLVRHESSPKTVNHSLCHPASVYVAPIRDGKVIHEIPVCGKTYPTVCHWSLCFHDDTNGGNNDIWYY